MSLIAKETGEKKHFDPVSAGVHLGVCSAVIDLGTHHNELFDKDAHKVLITWEIPSERIEVEKDGKKLDLPRVISKTFTLSLHAKASLRQTLEAWRGRAFTKEELNGFDLKNVLGTSCQIQVLHQEKGDKTFANVGSVMPLISGMTAPRLEQDRS